jgi:3-dehydroquinate synthase
MGQFLPERTHKVFIITSEDVWTLHGKRLPSFGKTTQVLYFPGGESRKRMAEVEALAEQMAALGADRTSVVIAFGGGIVTDLAGFTAAIFMRGIPCIQVPTTLLAQVDAGIGGKTGANLINGKNLVGAFHQPLAVIIDPDVLATLPDREYVSGLAEIVKSAIIRDPALFELMEQSPDAILRRDPDLQHAIVSASVRIKAEVVSADEKESGLRRILNFGHTVGHALEAETRYERFLHGEAVYVGMRAATRLAELTGDLESGPAARIGAVIAKYAPNLDLAGIEPDALLGRLAGDKKTVAGKVHFVLPVRIGETVIRSGIEESLIRQAIVTALAS